MRKHMEKNIYKVNEDFERKIKKLTVDNVSLSNVCTLKKALLDIEKLKLIPYQFNFKATYLDISSTIYNLTTNLKRKAITIFLTTVLLPFWTRQN